MFHDPLLSLYPKTLGPLQKKIYISHFSQNDHTFYFLIFVSDKEINKSSTADFIPRDGITVTSALYSDAGAVSNPSVYSSPSSFKIFYTNRHNSNSVPSVSYTNRSLSNPSSESISTTLSSSRSYSDLFEPIHC